MDRLGRPLIVDEATPPERRADLPVGGRDDRRPRIDGSPPALAAPDFQSADAELFCCLFSFEGGRFALASTP